MDIDKLKRKVTDAASTFGVAHKKIIYPLGEYLKEHGYTTENPLDITPHNVDVWGWFGCTYDGTYERVTKVASNDNGDPIYSNGNHEEWYVASASMNTSEIFFLAIAVSETKF